ncbi:MULTISPECIES: hypothetical protein [unclassified Streptomyces]|uniref:hypothetical protein n=1 Tax=unclassified Streptomyces TaxID=2593676 RepID=UPI002E2D2D84|nr:hypothetical protein [Streptomyces sp. NBC_00223]
MEEIDRWIHVLVAWTGAVVVYVLALSAGLVMVCSGKASVPEATGYVTPFLLVHVRMAALLGAVPQPAVDVRPRRPGVPCAAGAGRSRPGHRRSPAVG